jgi:y4mF family transcriptional regulator
MDKHEIGKSIRKRRQELGITQGDLAELSNTSDKTVRAVERGQGNPRLDTLLSILGVLGLSMLIASITSHEQKR